MQTLNCTVGAWSACATVEKLNHGSLMAIIQVLDREDAERVNSRHTVVFGHQKGSDAIAATQAMMQELLGSRYGA